MARSNNIEALKKWIKENGAWNNSHTTYTCINCSKTFSDSPSEKRKFCSTDCYANNIKTQTGEIARNWKGGKSNNNKCADCQKHISYASRRCKKCAVKLIPHMYIKNRQEIFAKYGWEIIFFNEIELNNEDNVLNVLKGGKDYS